MQVVAMSTTIVVLLAGAEKPVAAQSCTFQGERLSLLTVARSQVSLQLRSGRLEGTFQTSGGGKSYLITMAMQ